MSSKLIRKSTPAGTTTTIETKLSLSPPTITSNSTTPSFKAFSKEIDDKREELIKSKRHLEDNNNDLDEIKPVELEDKDGRILKERLINPTIESNEILAALLTRTIQLQHGELILSIGIHNLFEDQLLSILDSPIRSSTKSTTTTTSAIPTVTTPLTASSAEVPGIIPDSTIIPIILPLTVVNQILTTLKSITSEINTECSILHNPFSESGHYLPLYSSTASLTQKSLHETPSSKNDEVLETRWSSKTLKILIRRIPENAFEIMESRVAVVGNVDAGKSSLLGVLTKMRLDDGRGKARQAIFRHQHELESGRTSSVGMEILGFLPSGQEVVPEGPHGTGEASLASAPRKQQLSWESISSQAAKVISFADLAGHEKYLKTTLFGLTATSPDFVLLIVGANAGLIGMSKEHLSVALALSVPVVCVVTKIDMTPPNVTEQTLKQLVKVLKSPGCRKTPVFVKDAGMACELASSYVEEKTCPIFLVSNVTGEGLNLLRTFLNVVPTNAGSRYPIDADLEFSISDVFSVPFVGTVVSGVILSGKVAVGDSVVLGPDSLGAFVVTVIKSIQRKRVNVLHAEAGQSVSFGLKKIKRAGVRKGMVILERTDPPSAKAVTKFEGQVLILYHNTLIAPRYQAMLHVGSVRQTVQIEAITDKACIRTGDRATCTFKFLKYPEYIKVGDRFLFREGKTKALGVVSAI